MHPNTFLTSTHTKLISSSTFIITISALLITNVICSNQEIEVCIPSRCGNLSSISYPFWVFSKQESHCGHPNFKITCKNNKTPILRISNNDYQITHIDTHSHTFQLAYDGTVSCPVPLHNVSFEHTPFGFLLDEANFYLFYNCSSPPSELYEKYPISCAHKNDSIFKSFGDFHVEVLELFNYSLGLCQSVIAIPVDIDEGQGHDEARYWHMNYKEILRQGFTLNWTDHDCAGCENSGGRCGFDNNQFIWFCRDKTRSKTCDDGKDRRRIVIGILVTVLGSIILLTALLFIYWRHYKRHQGSPPLAALNKSSTLSSATSDHQNLNRSTYFGVQVFTYKELVKATDNFNPLKELGDGGYGTVYYGKLRDGREVAIKRLYENNQKKAEQFMNEVEILAHLRHQNLVTLYGCTSRQSRELLLVYEYISNGTVAEHLHGKRARQGLLPWPRRLNIAVETANALVYLHASDIIHRDVKTQNILLDKDFSVKVADFGLSRLFPLDVSHVSTAPQGTPGYVDPEYHQCYQLTEKSDVYSFGVVLAELISSKPAVDITRPRQEINLFNMAVNKIQNHSLHELVDPSFGFETDFEVREEITKVAEVAFQCLQSTRDMRPSMEKVLEMLSDIQGNGKEGDSKADIVDLSSDDVLMSTGDHSPTSPPAREDG